MATVVAHDVTRAREVGGENQRAGIGVSLDERSPRPRRVLAVIAEAARPLRLGDLHDPVHEVTRKNRDPAVGLEPDADVTWRMTGRRLEAEPRIDRVARVDQCGPAGLDDRHDAVRDALVLFVVPVLPLLPRDE